jgi:hypothetical protein
MLPDLWGPCAWKFLHYITLDYPINPTPADKEHYYQFFESLQYVLPCGTCRKNLQEHLKNYPLTDSVLSSRESLVKWMINLHNIVNYYTNKPLLSFPKALDEIENYSKPNRINWYQILIVIIIILLVIFIIFYLRKN